MVTADSVFSQPLITRFAPSPTGSLHLGGVRTALFCWLLAKQHAGQCLLRIEDTDKERSSEQSVEQIVQSFSWLAMDFDDITRQSERTSFYQLAITQLVEQGKAYVCNCSPQRLQNLRDTQLQAKQKPRYDGKCRNKGLAVSAGTVVRLRFPIEGVTTFNDIIYGTISVANSELDDFIIRRSDGSPTYNLCCVVDDYAMRINIVIRGDDHINNTPKQLMLYRALGYVVPQFAHLPMILGKVGKRFSKRHGAQGVLSYRDQGYVPDAMLNYLARLGWSYKNQEFFHRQELIDTFSVNKVSKSSAVFDTEKLAWVNKQHMQHTNPTKLVTLLENFATSDTSSSAIQLRQALQTIPVAKTHKIIETLQSRADNLIALEDELMPFMLEQVAYVQKDVDKHLLAARSVVIHAIELFETFSPWQADQLRNQITMLADSLSLKMPKVGMPLRVAVTGRASSPDLAITFALLGKKRVLQRLAKALEIIDAVHVSSKSE